MKFKEYLLEKDFMSREDLKKAIKEKKEYVADKSLEEFLIENEYIKESILLQFREQQLGIPRYSMDDYEFDITLTQYFSKEFAISNQVVPLSQKEKILKMGMVNPGDLLLINMIENITNLKIKPFLMGKGEIKQLIHRIYASLEKKDDIFAQLDVEHVPEETTNDDNLEELIKKAPIVKLTKMVLFRAIENKASDIHLEPQEEGVRVRYRIDGLLRTVMNIPDHSQSALISRFKVIADLDITEQRLPQDGRIEKEIGGRKYDMRISTIPTIYGEKIVIRILNKDNSLLNINQIGFNQTNERGYRQIIKSSKGIVLLTGPTGSGKTTTLFAALNELNSEEKNIITIEDPVEYQLKGVNQINIKSNIGLGFAQTMRSILRQDPDIIMLGEIRDEETARIAIRAALTGHLVLTTLHTNDAISSITRLLDMGIPSYLLAPSLRGIVAQRLVRRLCPHCRQKYIPETLELDYLRSRDKTYFYRPMGCNECKNSGYKGRVAIHELLIVDQNIKNMISNEKPREQIKNYAQENGMLNLKEDGLEKVSEGLTSLSEIIRVLN